MRGLGQDLRLAARVLARSPGFAAVVVIALGLGLGVSTAVFNVVNRFLLQPIAVAHPEQVVRMEVQRQGEARQGYGLSYPEILAVSAAAAGFSGVAGASFESFAISGGDARRGRGGDPPAMVSGELVTGDFLDVLGLQPALGRGFSADEGTNPGAAMVIVISDGLWRRRFGADPAVLGRKLFLNQNALTIIGVMPAAFKGAFLQDRMEFWCPLAGRTQLYGGDDGKLADRHQREIEVLARLGDGVTLAQANDRLAVVSRALAHDYPETNGNMDIVAVPEIRGRYGRYYEPVRLACGLALIITCLVLLIACANVANLLLARATARTRDTGIRLALGAGRGRIARQLLVESLLLAVLGGATGLLLALWFGDLMHAFVPPKSFRFDELGFVADARTMTWAVATSLGAGLLCGVLPAWRAARVDVLTALKTDVGGAGHRLGRGGLRSALVVVQLAVSMVVVVCAGLFARSLGNLKNIDPGFRADTLVSGLIDPTLVADYTDGQLLVAYAALKQRLQALPGVTSVSSSRYLPLWNWEFGGPIVKEGDPPPPDNQGLMSGYNIVDENYFQTMATDLVLGRDFTAREHDGSPSVVIVNQHLARKLFGSEPAALGHRFRAGAAGAPLMEIVAIARDGRYRNLFEDRAPWFYLPSLPVDLKPIDNTLRIILIRTAGPQYLRAAADGFRAELANLDARIPIEDMEVGADHLSWAMYIPRLAAQLGVLLGLLALALAAMGIYSLMTYTVSQRTKEIGIRIALGGRVRDVLKLVMGQALALVTVGVAVGTGAALLVAHFLTAFLYGVGAADPLTVAGTVVILVVVAMLATLLPARRAARVDPMVALRYE